MTPALILAATLMTSAAPTPDVGGGEPLPPGAPTEDYQLTAWCYGALREYLDVYERVKPELVDINRMFGDPVQESEPYQSDMAAARVELGMIGNAVTLAEKASPQPISAEGAQALRQGELIWSVAEAKTRRELARAWLLWALPDKCDTVARNLAAKSALFGKALKYNTGPDAAPPDVAAMADLPHAPLPGTASAPAPMTPSQVEPSFADAAPPPKAQKAEPPPPPVRVPLRPQLIPSPTPAPTPAPPAESAFATQRPGVTAAEAAAPSVPEPATAADIAATNEPSLPPAESADAPPPIASETPIATHAPAPPQASVAEAPPAPPSRPPEVGPAPAQPTAAAEDDQPSEPIL